MSLSNRDYIDRALLQLRDALRHYVPSLLPAAHRTLRKYFLGWKREFDLPISEWDARMLLRAIKESWNDLSWPRVQRAQIEALLVDANDFCHQREFDDNLTDTFCALVWQVTRQVAPEPGPEVGQLFKRHLDEAWELMSWQPTHTWYWPEEWGIGRGDQTGAGWTWFVDTGDGDHGRSEGVNLCITPHAEPYRPAPNCPALDLAATLLERAKCKNALVFLHPDLDGRIPLD